MAHGRLRRPITYPVCGVKIAGVTLEEAAHILVDCACSGAQLGVHLCNAYTLSLVDQDERLRRALEGSDLNLPDGTPVAWLGRRKGVRGPVRGNDLVKTVATVGAARGLRHYLYGGGPGVAEMVEETLRDVCPTVLIAGRECPPYHDLNPREMEDLALRVTSANANILWIGIGTPRQDYLVGELSQHLSMPLVPVGAAFDFLAGSVPEAPPSLRGTGTEWMFRLLQDPRRLGKRYLLGNPRFIVSALRHGLRS